MAETRLAGADFVRAFACLMVVGHHVAQRISPRALDPVQAQSASWFMMGAAGVAAFFVLSGYLLARPFWLALDARKPMPSLRTYALRRAARIVPGFYLALSVAFILSFTLLGANFESGLVQRYVAGLLFVGALHWFTWFPVEFNLPLWSIGCEVFSYALLAVGMLLLFRLPFSRGVTARVVWLVVIGGAVAAQAAMLAYAMPESAGRGWEYGSVGGAKFWWPNYNPVGFFAIFAIGVLAAGLQVTIANRRHMLFDLAAFAGLGIATWAIVRNFPAPDAFGVANVPYAFPLFPLGIGLVLIAVPSSVVLLRVTENVVIAYVARVSFGVYVWHYFLMEIVRVLWQPDYVYWGMRDSAQWGWASAGVVTASFLIATLSYYLLEEPVIRWARTLERRSTPDAPTLSPAAG